MDFPLNINKIPLLLMTLRPLYWLPQSRKRVCPRGKHVAERFWAFKKSLDVAFSRRGLWEEVREVRKSSSSIKISMAHFLP